MGLEEAIPDDVKENRDGPIYGRQHNYSRNNQHHNKIRNVEEIDTSNIDDGTLYWLGGFFDGEGSVSFQVARDKSSGVGYRVNIQVRASQHRISDEDEIFKSLIDELGVGKLYTEKSKSEGEFLRLRMAGMRDSIKFLKTIQPYTRFKEEEIDDAIDIGERLIEGDHLEKESLVDLVEDVEKFIQNHRTETQSKRTLKHNSNKLESELL